MSMMPSPLKSATPSQQRPPSGNPSSLKSGNEPGSSGRSATVSPAGSRGGPKPPDPSPGRTSSCAGCGSPGPAGRPTRRVARSVLPSPVKSPAHAPACYYLPPTAGRPRRTPPPAPRPPRPARPAGPAPSRPRPRRPSSRSGAEDPVPSGHLIRPSEVDDVGSQEGRGRGVGEHQREVALQRAERSPGGRRGGALERAPRAGGGPAAATGE